MADLRVITKTPCASDPVIENAVLKLLDFVRKNKVYDMALAVIGDDKDDPDGFMGWHDLISTGEYDLENVIDLVESLADTIIDVQDADEDEYDGLE